MDAEDMPFGKEMIIRGSLERLAPVMMTAMTSFYWFSSVAFWLWRSLEKNSISIVSRPLWRHACVYNPRPTRDSPLFYLFGSSEPPIAARNPVND